MIAIGVMSGTSCDGADAIALRLASVVDPHEPLVVAHAHEPYPPSLREELLRPASITVPRLAEIHYLLPEIYAKAVRKLGCHEAAACCGMHGQTIWHAPPSKGHEVPSTLQIGSTAVLAHRLGIPVVGDLRGADVAEGGEGAPIVPFTHWFFTPPERRPRVIVNFGGIANMTVVGEAPESVRGYDVGPGMMISDAHAARATRGVLAFDRDGAMSRDGAVIPALVDAILAHPFLRKAPPKSTGREDFGEAFFGPILEQFDGERANDVAASVLYATASALAQAIERDDGARRASEVVLSGGGAQNPTLVRMIGELLAGKRITVPTEGVLLPDHHEPAAVALIAARTLAGLPSSLPSVTGARSAARLGHIHWP